MPEKPKNKTGRTAQSIVICITDKVREIVYTKHTWRTLMEKVWVIKDPDQYLYPRHVKRITKGLPFADEKNPARAYTLSLFFWGGGQNYNNQRGKGLLFQVLMIIFLTGTILSFFYRNDMLPLLQTLGISNAEAFISGELLFFCILIFWTHNAGDAYHTAAKARRVPFAGVQSRVWPLLCSLLVPGWGQFLNGQPVKGSIFAGFSVLGIFSLVSIPSVLMAWPYLEVSKTRFVLETIFTVTVLYAPLIPFIWLLGGYDALIVSLDDIKKEPLIDRIRSANNRLRTQGWVRGIVPQFRLTIALGLLLIALSIAIYRYFPSDYYGEQLVHAQTWLRGQGMTMVPELVSRLLSVMARVGK